MICIQFSQSSKPVHPLFPLLSGGFLCVYVCSCVLGGTVVGVFLTLLSGSSLSDWFGHKVRIQLLRQSVYSMAKNTDVFWDFYQGRKECYFCFDYIHALINDYHCLSFQRSSHFSSVTFSLFPEPVGKRESTLHFWKKFFQEASLTLLSQQAAHVETIVKIWHSAIDENRTCHLLQGLLWKFVFGSQIRKIYSSIFAAQSHFLLLRVV